MREILFRGKQKDNNKWIEGFFLTSPEFNENGIGVITTPDFANRKANYVTLNTVGQYTGIPDRKGNKIFEGDIIKFAEWSKGEMCWIGAISFENTMFQIKGNPNKECDAPFVMQLSRIPSERIEIIGNIFDNPELIKEAT